MDWIELFCHRESRLQAYWMGTRLENDPNQVEWVRLRDMGRMIASSYHFNSYRYLCHVINSFAYNERWQSLIANSINVVMFSYLNLILFEWVPTSVKAVKMESLAVFLEPYKNVISGTASVVTYFHSLSGLIVCNSIRKQKSTADLSIMPFLAGTLM